jgi:hypothetical protein
LLKEREVVGLKYLDAGRHDTRAFGAWRVRSVADNCPNCVGVEDPLQNKGKQAVVVVKCANEDGDLRRQKACVGDTVILTTRFALSSSRRLVSIASTQIWPTFPTPTLGLGMRERLRK